MGHLGKGGIAQRHSERRKKSLFRCALEHGIYSIHEKIMGGRKFYTSYSDTVSCHVYYRSFSFGYRAFWSYHGSFRFLAQTILSLCRRFWNRVFYPLFSALFGPLFYPRYLHSQKDLPSIPSFPGHLSLPSSRNTLSPSLFF